MKNITTVMDNTNIYPPFWELDPVFFGRFPGWYVVIFLIWIFIYFQKIFKSNMANFIGFLSGILFIMLHDFMYQTPYHLHKDNATNRWIVYRQKSGFTSSEFLTNLKAVETAAEFNPDKTMTNLNQVDFKTQAYVVTDKYFDAFKKNNTVTPMHKLFDDVYRDTSKIPTLFSDLVSFRAAHMNFQGYAIITILFTLLTLTYNISHSLFKRLFPVFLTTMGLATAAVFFWLWWYSGEAQITLIGAKTHILFVTLSLTLAIIVEIIQAYT